MTLKNQIALTFTIITSSLLIGSCGIIYYFSYQYTLNDYYLRLRERANVMIEFMLDRDEMNQRVLGEIRKGNSQTLVLESAYLVKLDQIIQKETLPSVVDSQFVAAVNKGGYAEQTVGNISVVGVHFKDEEGDFAVIVSAKDEWGLRKLRNLRQVILAIVLTYLVLVFFIGRWYARQTLLPLTDIIRRMRNINTTNLYQRLPESEKSDEINQLAHTFNNLLNRIETSVESQNNFISNASHELKNPLTAILGQIELALQQERPAAEYRQSLVQIEHEAERLKNLTLHLLRLAQTGFSDVGKDFITIRLDELLLEVVEELQQTQQEANRIVLCFEQMPEEPKELELSANPNLLKIVFTNVLDNALKFSSDKPVEVIFYLTLTHFVIQICDQGIGIPEADLPNIHQPFFRGSNTFPFRGYGVGLSLTQKIMDIHEGTLEVQSLQNQGTTVILSLPRNQF